VVGIGVVVKNDDVKMEGGNSANHMRAAEEK
jgi:hypothetical protein